VKHTTPYTTGIAVAHADLSALIDAHLSDDLLKRALRAVFQAKKVAYDHCAAEFLSPSDAENVRPFYARGKIQELMREIVTPVASVEAQTVKSDGSFWNHTEIVSGPVIMTAHSVQTPCGLVAGTDYQLSLASDQDALFGDDEPSEHARVYALLLHSPFRGRNDAEQREFAYLPGSVYVAFPAPGIKYYVHHVNLFTRFPDVIERLMPNQWDESARVHYKWAATQRASA
jgi:hypothetical protein